MALQEIDVGKGRRRGSKWWNKDIRKVIEGNGEISLFFAHDNAVVVDSAENSAGLFPSLRKMWETVSRV